MSVSQKDGIIAWFAKNPVAANLLMAVILCVGLASAFKIQRAMFPAFDIEALFIEMFYPGAPPEEVEKGLVYRIEDAINDVDGIKRVESDAFESRAQVIVQPQDGADLSKLMSDVENRINAIQTFPDAAEKPIVAIPELQFPALSVAVSGALDERGMKALAEEVRQEMLSFPEISAAKIFGARDYEIAIQISETLLREYHLTLGKVAETISKSSLDLPAGSLQTRNGDITLRTIGQAYVQQDFESIVLKTFPDGTRLLLGEIATVNDGFVDGSGFASFDGNYGLNIDVYAMGSQDIVETANVAKAYIENKITTLPEGVKLTVWGDSTYYLKDRLRMMLRNLAMGALLVFITLALFLEIKLAFWVMVGIPVCFFGAMAILNTPYVDASLNMISLFGFILVLGIVVDDAIIIGESAYAQQEKTGPGISSVITGVHEVAIPATFGVLTTIAAFMPTLFIDGVFAAFPEACGQVVILCLCFSLIESKWILPAHLAHSKPTQNKILLEIDSIQEGVNAKLRRFVEQVYQPGVTKCINNRYATLTFFISILILCFGLLTGGVVRTVIAPEVPGEFLQVELRMREGAPIQETIKSMELVRAALTRVEEAYVEDTGDRNGLVKHFATYGWDRINGVMIIELTKEDKRVVSTREIERNFRKELGFLHGVEVLSISAADPSNEFGPDIALDLMHDDLDKLSLASADLEEALRHYAGLYDIRNGASDSSDEFHLNLLPEAESLGLTLMDLGNQVRHAFYGAEAQRVQRGIDEIKVMVRYPEADRKTIASLDGMYIRTPNGNEVPFNTVASIDVEQGALKATHINYQRAAEITAEANKDIVEPGRIMSDITTRVLPELVTKYPGLSWGVSGMSDEEKKVVTSMGYGFALALFAIYALLAIPTKSYLQPLIIMGVIPFGVIGAIFGHWVMGHPMSMMSLMGVIALSGVVVNDSLILVNYINNKVRAGSDLESAVLAGGTRRFRPILLTSLTTFFGLAPMLMETSVQAQEIIPMAVSLAFGIIFATVITLLLVPCLYLILADLNNWRKLYSKQDELSVQNI